jgi:hypothetical protein
LDTLHRFLQLVRSAFLPFVHLIVARFGNFDNEVIEFSSMSVYLSFQVFHLSPPDFCIPDGSLGERIVCGISASLFGGDA